MTDTASPALAPRDFDCPRCGGSVSAAFYGPCDTCRADLQETMAGEAREVEKTEYEPKMNVVPNHVATKE